MPNVNDLLYTWNDSVPPHLKTVELEDDTLRDGLQGAFSKKPSLAQKFELLKLSAEMGVKYHMLGFPASSSQELEDCRKLVRTIDQENLKIIPRFLGRARIEDVEPIAQLNDEAGVDVWADFFIGTGPLRRHVEGWDFNDVLEKVSETGTHLRSRGCHFGVSLEDSSRTPPDDLEKIIAVAADSGAEYLTICDTVGVMTPGGARRLMRFVLNEISKTGKTLSVTWHGHNDRGLALVNALAAAEEGAGVISGAFLGIGERCGNTALEQVMMYLYQHGAGQFHISGIPAYCQRLAEYVDLPIAKNAPLVGDQAFATCTGTHAAAVLKARNLGKDFEDFIFSCIPASKLGRAQELMIGPLSGLANAKYMLELISVEPTMDNANKLLEQAKRHNRWLEMDEIRGLFLDIQTKDADK